MKFVTDAQYERLILDARRYRARRAHMARRRAHQSNLGHNVEWPRAWLDQYDSDSDKMITELIKD